MGIALSGLALSAPVGMINGVHRDAADMRPPALPSSPSCFANGDIFMIGVSDLSDGRVTLDVDLAHFAGRKPHLRVTSLLGHELRGGAGRADELTAATPFQLDGHPVTPAGPAPYRVGEHTRAVLGDLLGYKDRDIDDLVQAGVIEAP